MRIERSESHCCTLDDKNQQKKTTELTTNTKTGWTIFGSKVFSLISPTANLSLIFYMAISHF